MSPAIEKEFFERWSTFFTHQGDPMGFRFTCGDGWRQIIFDLFREIEQLVAIAPVDEPLEILRVKERFGELRVHTNSSRPEIMAAIDLARRKSRDVCEVCSKPGRLIAGSPWGTRCARCAGDINVCESYDRNGAPQVGVFWLVRLRLVTYGMPLEPGDEYRDYPRRHAELWPQHETFRVAPIRADWSDYPRGRVIFDTAVERFHIYADRCILARPELLATIIKLLNLPANTEASADDCYRCRACMRMVEDRAE